MASQNGILPIPIAMLQKQPAPNLTPRGQARKPTSPRLKVVLRRLPPGLTESEFDQALGEEWKVGAGKVDWRAFEIGKISKDAAKPSRPGRAYIHLVEQTYLQQLSEKVQQTDFADAQNTVNDHALIGPPALEFAPYNRVPIGKKRSDRHQGTIDQDREFIAFLHALTNPVQRSSIAEADVPTKVDKVKTTPLIEAIREKKAAKEKPAALRAAAKAKELKASEKDRKATEKTLKEAAAPPEKSKRLSKGERAAKEALRVLNRDASAVAEKTVPTTGIVAAERRRERIANPISVAAKIQRDLGLGPVVGKRAKREQTPEAKPMSAAVTSVPPASTGAGLKKDVSLSRNRGASRSEKPIPGPSSEVNTRVPTGPKSQTILRKAVMQTQPPKAPGRATTQSAKIPNAPTTPVAATSEVITSSSTSSTTTKTSHQAFLKHANPSQGITEALIEEALKVFGPIESVEIDRKKGFAYVNYADSESLRKAIAGSPVKIAQGAVQILERRDRGGGGGTATGRSSAVAMAQPRGGFRTGRGGRGGRGGGRGGIAGSAVSSTATPSGAATVPQVAPSERPA